jgi:hypothetical protein
MSVMRTMLGILFGVLLAIGALTAPAQADPQGSAPAGGSVQGFWACSVPAGMTYTRVVNNLNVCYPGGWAYSYFVETPTTGLWACYVPSGFTYSRVANNLNVCYPGGFAYSYLLA